MLRGPARPWCVACAHGLGTPRLLVAGAQVHGAIHPKLRARGLRRRRRGLRKILIAAIGLSQCNIFLIRQAAQARPLN